MQQKMPGPAHRARNVSLASCVQRHSSLIAMAGLDFCNEGPYGSSERMVYMRIIHS